MLAPGRGGALTQGIVGDGMACLRLGTGPPLVFLPGLSSHHRPPQGMDRWLQVQQIRPFAGSRQVWWIQRRAGLAAPVTMADLAADYAGVLARQFAGPVDVLGLSTGGSVALQLAADHPDLVRRLVILCSGCRLGPRGRAAQRQVAALLREGRSRRAGAVMMSMLGATSASQRVLAGLGWLLGSAVAGRGDPDMLATIDAEDAFDLTGRLGSITAPALVIGGDHDAFYGPSVFQQTAALLPQSRLVLYPGKGHAGTVTSRRLLQDVLTFLQAAPGSPARP
jgi:pimeloyl-ACP methyl ester carboxylesterase